MQNIIIEKPYEFIPPVRETFWSSCVLHLRLIDYYLRRWHGVDSYECRGVDRLKASLAAGHAIMLTPNHSRPCDPVALGFLGREAGTHMYAMASWHLFHEHWFLRWALTAMGGFSIYREGIDRQAINFACEMLESTERPLLIFPEGATTRTNDKLHAMLDGVAFIARTAAKRRAKSVPGGKVVIHPVAIKYFFRGDLHRALDPVLADMERRFTWGIRPNMPLVQRIYRIGHGLLALKEVEYFGQPKCGSLHERLSVLIDRLLSPLEQEWLGTTQTGGAVPRVKALRMKIMPEMVQGGLAGHERERRWHQLADIYLAQQVSCYPPDYLVQRPSVDRLFETVERFEEDLTDRVTVHGRLHVVLQVGEAIEISPERDRKATVDPIMAELERRLQGMLDELALESPLFQERGVGGPVASLPESPTSGLEGLPHEP